MLGVNKNSECTFHIRWNELVTFQGQLKWLISPFLEMSFETSFDSDM